MKTKTVIIGGGCFWCVEAIFNRVKGIQKTVSGYAGENVLRHPAYREVCSGLTGCAEVVKVSYNPKEISYREILIIFMTTHDSTTLNRQGSDVGTQYRSVIFFQNEEEKMIAQKIIAELQQHLERTIVTEVSELPIFYPAEEYHQNYYENNKEQDYCNFVITPKLAKLRKLYADKLKQP